MYVCNHMLNLDKLFIKELLSPHVDEVFVVSDEQVPEDSGLVEVAEADHVLDPLHRGRVHGLDATLRGQPLLLAVVVDNL